MGISLIRLIRLYAPMLCLLALACAPPIANCDEEGSSATAETGNFKCTAIFSLYDPVEITSLNFGIRSFTNSSCMSLVPEASISYDLTLEMTGFPSGFQGPAPLVSCTASFAHDDCPPHVNELPVTIYELAGPDGELANLPAICADHVECNVEPCGQDGLFTQIACGDADASGAILTSDALAALRAAVGLLNCLPERCDTDRDGSVDASDARAILAASVGLHAMLICPAPCVSYSPGDA